MWFKGVHRWKGGCFSCKNKFSVSSGIDLESIEQSPQMEHWVNSLPFSPLLRDKCWRTPYAEGQVEGHHSLFSPNFCHVKGFDRFSVRYLSWVSPSLLSAPQCLFHCWTNCTVEPVTLSHVHSNVKCSVVHEVISFRIIEKIDRWY